MMVYLLHFPATIAVSNLKYSLLIKPVLAICPETGRMLPSQTGPGLDYETMNHLEGRVPHSPGQAGQDYHVITSSTAICSSVACKESNGVGCCLLAYKCGLKEQSTEQFFK